MFNINYYKLFNPDLKYLNNQQLYLHFKIKGINENRIYNYDSFYKKYPKFNLKTYKKHSVINFNNKNSLSIMLLYHINQQAKIKENILLNVNENLNDNINVNINENLNDNVIVIDNVNDNVNDNDNDNFNDNVNDKVNDNININVNDNIDYNVNDNVNEKHLSISNKDINQSILLSIVKSINQDNKIVNPNSIDKKYNKNYIDSIFIINQKIHLTKVLNFLNDFFYIKYQTIIYIFSVENIDIYKELYKNIVIIYIPYIHDYYINYYLRQYDQINNLLLFLDKIPLNIDLFNKIESYLQYKNNDYIYFQNNIHIITKYNLFPYLYISYNLPYYFILSNKLNYIFNNYQNKYDYNTNNKFINILQKKNKKKINNYNKNILINFKIESYEEFICFFYILQFCEDNKWNLFLKNGQCSIFNNFCDLNIQNNYKICNNITKFKDSILENNNIIINSYFFDNKINYQQECNQYLDFSKIEEILHKLYFLNFDKKIIGIYIDKNNYDENFIINTLSTIPFEEYYIFIFCEDNYFLKEITLLEHIVYINIFELDDRIFKNNEILFQYFLICDYVLLPNNFIALLFSFINNTTIIFLPYNGLNLTEKKYENEFLSENFLYINYIISSIQFISNNSNFIDFNNIIVYFFDNYYILYKGQFIIFKENINLLKKYLPVHYFNLYMIQKINSTYSFSCHETCINTIYENSFSKKILNNIDKISNTKNNSIVIFKNKHDLYIQHYNKIIKLSSNEKKIVEFISFLKNKPILINYIKNNNYLVENRLLQNLYYFIIETKASLFEYTLYQLIRFNQNYSYSYLLVINDCCNINFDYNQQKQNILNKNSISYLDSYINIYINKLSKPLNEVIQINNKNIHHDSLIIILNNYDFCQYHVHAFIIYYLFFQKTQNYNIVNDDKNNDNDDNNYDNNNYDKLYPFKFYLKKDINNILEDENLNKCLFSIKYFININYLYSINNYINNNTILKYIIFLHEYKKKYLLHNNIIESNNILESINNELKKYTLLLHEKYNNNLDYYLNISSLLTYQTLNNCIIEIIHIEHRKDKLNYLINELYKKEINNFNLFNGIIPNKNEIFDCSYIDTRLLLSTDNEKYIIGSVGCKMSHISLLEKYKKLYIDNKLLYHQEYLLICEDDILFDYNFQVYLEIGLKALINEFNNDFDLLYLGVNLQKKEDAYKVHSFLLRILKGFTTTAYIVKINNIDKILNILYQSKEEIDKVYSDSNLIKYCIFPMIVHQNNMKSDISYVKNGYGNYHEKFEFIE